MILGCHFEEKARLTKKRAGVQVGGPLALGSGSTDSLGRRDMATSKSICIVKLHGTTALPNTTQHFCMGDLTDARQWKSQIERVGRVSSEHWGLLLM